MEKYIVVMIVVMALSCAGEPREALTRASKAKETADAAVAHRYASETYEEGIKAWTDAEAAIAKRDFEKAKRDYVLATEKFTTAAAEAPLNRKAMADQATTGLEKLNSNLRSLSQQLIHRKPSYFTKMNQLDSKLTQLDSIMNAARNLKESDVIVTLELLTLAQSMVDELDAMLAPKYANLLYCQNHNPKHAAKASQVQEFVSKYQCSF